MGEVSPNEWVVTPSSVIYLLALALRALALALRAECPEVPKVRSSFNSEWSCVRELGRGGGAVGPASPIAAHCLRDCYSAGETHRALPIRIRRRHQN